MSIYLVSGKKLQSFLFKVPSAFTDEQLKEEQDEKNLKIFFKQPAVD